MASIPSTLASFLAEIKAAQKSLIKPNQRLDNAVTNSAANGLPDISVLPEQGAFLSLLCKLLKVKSVLELGTLGGYSTIWLAESTPDIKVTSVEIDENHHNTARENVQGLDNVELILGAALDVLARLAEENRSFDFIFVDAAWEEQQQYFNWAVGLARPGGCIFVDNVVRQLIEDEDKERGQALLSLVKADDRVDVAMVPIVNTHASDLGEIMDGFVLAFRK